jgi:hypothetical protein
MDADGTDLAYLDKSFESGAAYLEWWGTARSDEHAQKVTED